MKFHAVSFTLLLLIVNTVAAESGFDDSPAYACLIEPYKRIEIRSPVEALITKIHVDRGDAVKAGQVIVELDKAVEEAALAAAQYRSVMEGDIRAAKARVGYAWRKLSRHKELMQQNFSSAQERDDAKSELQLAKADLLKANDERKLAALEAKRIQALIGQRRLVSPFDGVVTELERHPGELARTREGAGSILRLAQVNRLRVEVVLPASEYGTVHPGDSAEIMGEGLLHGKYQAIVDVVDKVVDSASGTFGVRIQLENSKGEIPAGTKCRVRFDDEL